MSNPRSTAASVREQKLARVIDREVAPVWHDRFARLLLRELPTDGETFALDIHSGPGHTTAELLQRLSENSRIVALGRDPWLMQVSKTRVRPEWKRRVYFKSGDIDDVTGMNDDTYSLTVANLVLGEQVVDWEPALAELMRVTKPGGQVLATLPLAGTWREVEDLFEEMLRDEGMRREVATLQKLRRRRPKAGHLAAGLQKLGLSEHDFVVEHERFELLFRSGREFLFAPVIEHGPLRLWKAIIGGAEKPQALFWRFKETIDTYYAGHVLAVTVVAGLVRLRVPGEPGATSFAAEYWRRYPSLTRLWGGPGAEEDDDDDDEFDIDLDLDDAIDALQPAAAEAPVESSNAEDFNPVLLEEGNSTFEQIELSGLNELPAVDGAPLDDDDGDPFAGMLDELDAEAKAAAEIAAEDAKVEATVTPDTRTKTGRAATLAAVENSPLPSKLPPIPTRKAGSGPKRPPKPSPRSGDSGTRAKVKTPSKPGKAARSSTSGTRAKVKTPSKPVPAARSSESGVRAKPRRSSESGVRAKPSRSSESGVRAKTPRSSESGIRAKPARSSESGVRAKPARSSESGVRAKPARSSESGVRAKPSARTDSAVTPLPGKLPPKPVSGKKLPPPKKKTPGKKKKLGKLADRLPRRSSSSMTAMSIEDVQGDDGTKAAKKPAAKKKSTAKKSTAKKSAAKKPAAKKSAAKKSAAKKSAAKKPAAKKPAAKKPAAKKSAAKKPAAKKPAPKPPVAKAVPAPSVTKPGEEDPFAAMLEDDDDLEEIDELEELPSDSLVDGHFDDDDFEAAFGDLEPDTNVGPPPPPKKKK